MDPPEGSDVKAPGGPNIPISWIENGRYYWSMARKPRLEFAGAV